MLKKIGTIALLAVCFLIARCGTSKKNNNDTDGPPPSAGELPPDWDGKTDWQGGDWEVTNP